MLLKCLCCFESLHPFPQMTVADLLSHMHSVLKGKPQLPAWLWQAALRAAVLVCGTLMLLMARVKVMGAQLPIFTRYAIFITCSPSPSLDAILSSFRFDNPAAVADTPSRQLTLNYLLPVNSWLLLYPAFLCCDWTMGTIPIVSSVLDMRNLATVAFYAVLGSIVLFVIKRRGKHMQPVVMVTRVISVNGFCYTT